MERHSVSVENTYVRVVRDFEGIEEIRSQWQDWQGHPNSDLDFCTTIMRSVPDVIRPHILVLYRGGTPRAMLVGRFENGRINVKIGYRNVMRIKTRLLTFIYRGFLGETSVENAKTLVREIRSSLRQGEADAAMLSSFALDSPLFRATTELSSFVCQDHVPRIDLHRSMLLPGDSDAVLAGLSAKVRKNLKWQAKKIIQEFGSDVRIRVFRQAAELEEMIRDVEKIAAKTYQRGIGVGFAVNPEMVERLELEAKKGWMRTFVLYLGCKPVAFWMGTLYQDIFYSAFMGYDPEYAKHSIGMFLIMKTIESFCQNSEGDRPQQIDFGFGDAQYKVVLGNREWSEACAYLFAPSIKGLGINFIRTPAMLANQMAINLLGKMNLLQKAKKIWRRQVTDS